MEEVRLTLGKLLSGPIKTWRLYRHSKTGLAGLAIVLTFLIMAVFAPVISPYSADFKAPGEDIFVADNVELDLGEQLNWTAVLGLSLPTRERPLERIMVYSSDGVTKTFGVSTKVEGGVSKIEVTNPITYDLPAGADYLAYVYFPRTASEPSFFLILKGNVLYEYTSGLIYANQQYELPFDPIYSSNLWNGYSQQLTQARMALALADEHNIWLLVKRPRLPLDNFVRTYTSNLTVDDARIIGNPLLIDSDYFENGSMVIVPTDAGLRAYELVVTTTELTKIVTDVRLGGLQWSSPYSYKNETFTPIQNPVMITFHNPEGATDAFSKASVYLATREGRVLSYNRLNGTVNWANPLIMPAIRDYEITGVYPSPEGVVVAGVTGERGFVAALNPTLGVVKENSTMYSLTDAPLNSAPQYVDGLRNWIYSSEKGAIYLTNELMQVNITFSAPSGGAATPVFYLGNLYIVPSVTGNYYGLVTKENTLFVQTLSGVNRAPLPPGKYPSGNRYLLGTDYEGHDILSWVIYGSRAELMVGVTAAFFAVVIGTIVGLVAGFYGGIIDDLLMRATDVVLALPGLVIILLFAAVFGPSLVNIVIIIAILSWAGIARVIRSVTLSLKKRTFVDAAIVAGASESRLIFKHIAPNVLPYTFLYMTFTISGAIITEAILAFLGFGDVNYVTWGMMLQYLQVSGHSLSAPWWLLPPGIAITLLSLAFYLIGRAFDEVVNPRLRRR